MKLETKQAQSVYLQFSELLANKPKELDFPYRKSMCPARLMKEIPKLHGLSDHQKMSIEKIPSLFASMGISDRWAFQHWSDLSQELQDSLKSLFSMFFPLVPGIDVLGFVGLPYEIDVFYSTKSYQEAFMDSDLAVEVSPRLFEENRRKSIIKAGCHILKDVYDIDLDLQFSEVYGFRETGSGLDRYFAISVDHRYVSVAVIGEKPKLSKKQIKKLLRDPHDVDLWLELLPPESFGFRGFAIGQFLEVTKSEIISILKDMMVEISDFAQPAVIRQGLQQLIRSYLRMPEVDVGFTENIAKIARDLPNDFGLLRDTPVTSRETFAKGTAHCKALRKQIPLVYSSSEELQNQSALLQSFAKAGYESILLLPLKGPDGIALGVMELASTKKDRFTGFHALELEEFAELLALGAANAVDNMEKQVNLIIQRSYTSLHPSVEWRFQQVVSDIWWKSNGRVEDAEFESVVFSNVHPMYGQADIVGSSTQRNTGICNDLKKNLEMAEKLLAFYQERINFHLLNVYQMKIGRFLVGLEREFNTSDENTIVAFLAKELHPLVRKISAKYPDLLLDVTNKYLSRLDPNLGVIYEDRRDYESSVSQINHLIGSVIEKADREMQEVMPHYFEHYKTDGVEYNMYLGDSISPEEGFSDQHLQNFRLWQLVNMVEVTQQVMAAKDKLPVPLETAQLIFVYNQPLSIRFRLDEKRFDVDGTYNVRYEILKKRIDKAYVKGTTERLTLANKIAIVYLEEKDKVEYLEYLDYLLSKGLIEDNIEELELEKLQGAEGLRALRVSVA